MHVLILGICSGLGRQLARRLDSANHRVTGIDVRPWPDALRNVRVHPVDLRKRTAEAVFREERPDVVIHLVGRSFMADDGQHPDNRTLDGTRAAFEYASAHGARQLLFVSRHTFYGAAADSPLYHQESHSPRDIEAYPRLADLVAADLYAATELWRMPQLATCILRPCYLLGPSGTGTLCRFLANERVPRVLGFDPLFQFLHEADAVRAIQLAVEAKLRGIYNVSGTSPLPLSLLIERSGRKGLALPAPVLRRFLGHAGLPRLPEGALSHLMYPIVVDGAAFARATGFSPAINEAQALEQFRARISASSSHLNPRG